MKTHLSFIGILASTFLLLSAGSMWAQPLETVVANVPFPFQVHGRVFPAGKYIVRVGENMDPALVSIRSARGNGAAFVMTEPVSANKALDKPELIFKRDENRYVLFEIWGSGETVGREVYPSAQW